MSLLHDVGPGTTIKASAACISHVSIHAHHRAARAPGGPVCSPKILMVGVAGLWVAKR